MSHYDQKKWLYHYTNDHGAWAITKSKRIRPSHPDNGDARFGPGTYATSIPPGRNSEQIARNNWDGLAWQALADQKVDKAIAFKLTPQAWGKVKTVETESGDVQVYKGKGGINLTDPNVVEKWCVVDRTYQGN